MYFKIEEFTCPCCGVAKANARLLAGLEDLRAKVGRPIVIVSGYRCPFHNKDVKGSPKSQHMLGNAADVVVRGMDPWDLAQAADSLEPFNLGGIIVYRTFVHLDVRLSQPYKLGLYKRRKL